MDTKFTPEYIAEQRVRAVRIAMDDIETFIISALVEIERLKSETNQAVYELDVAKRDRNQAEDERNRSQKENAELEQRCKELNEHLQNANRIMELTNQAEAKNRRF